MNWDLRYSASKKEVLQHIKTLKERGWDYLGRTGTGHHKMNWPHAPENKGIIRFAATPSDYRWLTNSQKDAQSIEKSYPAPVETPQQTINPPSTWDIRLRATEESAQARSLELQKLNETKQQEANRPLTVTEKMRLKREQMYKEKGL